MEILTNLIESSMADGVISISKKPDSGLFKYDSVHNILSPGEVITIQPKPRNAI